MGCEIGRAVITLPIIFIMIAVATTATTATNTASRAHAPTGAAAFVEETDRYIGLLQRGCARQARDACADHGDMRFGLHDEWDIYI